jgi:hypothetical protein
MRISVVVICLELLSVITECINIYANSQYQASVFRVSPTEQRLALNVTAYNVVEFHLLQILNE